MLVISLLSQGPVFIQGRKTRVVDVVISNQEKENVCKATFTMFVTGQRKEESQINI